MRMKNEPNEKDRKVLEMVASAKWITHKQLWDIARIINLEKNDNRKVFKGAFATWPNQGYSENNGQNF
jgi:hypothetical protein